MHLDLQTTEKLIEGLATLFYVAMGLAALIALLGSPGWAFLTLLLGAGALIVRTTIESLPRRPRA